jgi:hypothetical protein
MTLAIITARRAEMIDESTAVDRPLILGSSAIPLKKKKKQTANLKNMSQKQFNFFSLVFGHLIFFSLVFEWNGR